MGKCTYLPPSYYTMSKDEKTSLNSVVSVQDLKLIGLKSHDCHILMQQLLSVAIHGILPKNVRHTITRLCSFFSSIYCKVIDWNMIWEDVQVSCTLLLLSYNVFQYSLINFNLMILFLHANFEISNVESLWSKIISNIGLQFRQFKSTLTTKYIFASLKEKILV